MQLSGSLAHDPSQGSIQKPRMCLLQHAPQVKAIQILAAQSQTVQHGHAWLASWNGSPGYRYITNLTGSNAYVRKTCLERACTAAEAVGAVHCSQQRLISNNRDLQHIREVCA